MRTTVHASLPHTSYYGLLLPAEAAAATAATAAAAEKGITRPALNFSAGFAADECSNGTHDWEL
jgi:hypothetical protein